MVELVMVMAVIGILILIAIPMWDNVKNEAKSVSTMTTIRSVEKMVTAYSIDNGGAYPASLADIGQAFLTDAWGNQYVYTNLVAHPDLARLDPILGNPLNSDFDLYSYGADRQTNNSDSTSGFCGDDVIRSGNGGFVGVARLLMP